MKEIIIGFAIIVVIWVAGFILEQQHKELKNDIKDLKDTIRHGRAR